MARISWLRIGALASAAATAIVTLSATPSIASPAAAPYAAQPSSRANVIAGANAVAAGLPAPRTAAGAHQQPSALTPSSANGAVNSVAPNATIVCTIQSVVGRALGSGPFVLATARSATTCPVPMTNIVAQTFLYEFRNGLWTLVSIGNYANGPGFQASSDTYSDCIDADATRHYQVVGWHEAHKTGYIPARGYSTSGPRIVEC